jgi:hypothetical protein
LIDTIKGIKGSPILGIIVVVIIAFIITCCALLMFGALEPHEKIKNLEVTDNMTSERLPEDLEKVIEDIQMNRKIGVNKWEYDYKNKQFIIYVIGLRDENKVSDLQGKQIGNWTIKVIHDVSYEKERDLVRTEIMELEKDPELQIAESDRGAGGKEVNIWVFNLTPENQALNGKKIHGWTIHVWKLQPWQRGNI